MLPFIESLGTPGSALMAVAGFLALANLIGCTLLRGSITKDRAFLSLTLGIDVLVLLTLLLAWNGRLAWLTGLGAPLALVGTIGNLAVHRFRWPGWRSIPWQLFPLFAFSLLLSFNAFGYPYSWDDLTYQVALPQRWLGTGSLELFLDNPFSGFPAAFAIACLLLTALGGIVAPGVLNAVLWLLTVLQLYALLRTRLGRWYALSVASSFGFSLCMMLVATASYAELFLLLQVVAIVSVLQRAWGERQCELSDTERVLLGVFSGIAASVKLTGLIVPVLLGLVMLVHALRRRTNAKIVLRSCAAFAVPLAVVALPFFARPFLATGNPFYPYFAEWWVDNEATLATSNYHHQVGKGQVGLLTNGIWETAAHCLKTPWMLCLEPLHDQGRLLDGGYGLQFLAHYAVGGILLWRWWSGRLGQAFADQLLLVWLAMAFALYLFWLATAQQARFLLPAFWLLTFATGSGLSTMSGPLRLLVGFLLPVLTAISIPGRIWIQFVMSWNLLVGGNSPSQRLITATGDDYVAACAQVHRCVPSNGRVLLLFEQRGLYVPRYYAIGTPYFQERFFTPPEKVTTKGFLEVLHRENITHILVGWNVADPDRTPHYVERCQSFWQKCKELEPTHFQPIWHSRSHILYAVIEQGNRI